MSLKSQNAPFGKCHYRMPQRRKWLPKCLTSIQTQTIFTEIEVIIADNASEDDTANSAKALIENWPNAHFVPTGGDNGFDVACNLSAKKATGKPLYLLNPDTAWSRIAPEQFCVSLENGPAVAAGGTILEYEDNTIQATGSDGFDFFPVTRFRPS